MTAVTDSQLGQMVAGVHGDNAVYHTDVAANVGQRLREQLEAKGLTIVRSGEAPK